MKKIFTLIKKAWHYAWYRHHLLIPIPVLKKYISSFFRIIKQSGGITSDIFVSQKDYAKWHNNNPLKLQKYKKDNNLTIIYMVLNIDNKQIINSLKSINSNVLLVSYNKYKDRLNNLLKDNNLKVNIYTYDNNKSLSFLYNDIVKKITTDYVMFINSNIIFEKESFSYLFKTIEDNKNVDIIYSDSDYINKKEQLYNPLFKPDFAIDSYLGYNYFGNMVILSKRLINQVGRFNNKYNNVCFDDFLLRGIELSNNIIHIPYILYHDYEKNNHYDKMQEIILKDFLKRNKIKGKIIKNKINNKYMIKYSHNNPLVSIVIPFKNQFKITKTCIDNLINKNTYKNYELILIDNGSDEIELLNYLKSLKNSNIKIYYYPIEFNFSKLCNYGVKKAKGKYILLLNNDTKIIDNDFLDWMIGYAERKDIGAVGLKLLYSDRQVQHMGVVMGDGYATHFGVSSSENTPGHFDMCIRPYNFTAVTGACILVSKKKYLEVNGFEEKLTVALNDIDFCLKLIDKGYVNVCLNNIKMFHLESKSRGFENNKEKKERFEKERSFVNKKWGNSLKEDKYYSKYFY